jgi:hypothetical protein
MTADSLARTYRITTRPEPHPTIFRRWRCTVDVVYTRPDGEERVFPFHILWAMTEIGAEAKAHAMLDEMDEWERADNGSKRRATVTERPVR